MSSKKIRDFYEYEAIKYDKTRFNSAHGVYTNSIQRSAVFELIGSCRGKNILEIGSGTGRFTKELIKRGANVFCVDISRKMHETSQLYLHSKSLERFVMSGLKLGFDSQTFDGCLAVNVMSHISNELTLFREIKRVLKIDGFFVANYPNLSGIYFPIGYCVNLFKRSLQADVFSKWYIVSKLFDALHGVGLPPSRILGHIIVPKKFCPTLLLSALKYADRIISSNSAFMFFSGDLFVKCINYKKSVASFLY